jgi:hypothetical protein
MIDSIFRGSNNQGCPRSGFSDLGYENLLSTTNLLGQIKRLALWIASLFLCFFVSFAAHAQTSPSANTLGNSFWVGGEYSNMKAGFPINSSARLQGIGVFANYNWNHSIGVEARARFLHFDSWYGETQQDYLVGPRYTFLRNDKWRPFGSFQVGLAHIQYPFGMGTGNSFALVPGGGLEYRFSHLWSVRGSYEYQILTNSPDFTNEPKFGIRPNGFQFGISRRIF